MKRLTTLVLPLVAGISVSNLALSDDAAKVWPDKYTSIGLEYGLNEVIEDDDRPLEFDSYGEYGLTVEHQFSKHYSVFFSATHAEPDVENSVGINADSNSLSLSLRRLLCDIETGWRPFLGLGYTYSELELETAGFTLDEDENTLFLEGGFQHLSGDHLLFEGGLRLGAELDNEAVEVQPFVGLRYLIGQQTTKKVAATVPTPEPVAITPPKAEPQPLVAVVKTDGDNDGVYDDADQCPNTPNGALVDDKGCAQKLTRSVKETLYVTFESGKASVATSSYSEIEKVTKVMKQFPDTSVTVTGHTDSQGSAAFNKALSERRANGVKTVMVDEYGIDANRISVVGAGEEQPIADNTTADGRSKNRRVEASIEASITEIKQK